MATMTLTEELLDLARELGREERQLALLGEGNVSARLSDDLFLVKSSGSNLATLGENGLTETRLQAILDLLDRPQMGDQEIEDALMASRNRPNDRKPSVEASFHAYLLTLPGVKFVGHTHPVATTGLLCSKQARLVAERRLFPDHIVCCGAESAFVPYIDPGIPLARAIRDSVEAFQKRRGVYPNTIVLANHGVIACGPTAKNVLSAMLMMEKASGIFIAAATANGGEPAFMEPEQVARIAGRIDEHYRQAVLAGKI